MTIIQSFCLHLLMKRSLGSHLPSRLLNLRVNSSFIIWYLIYNCFWDSILFQLYEYVSTTISFYTENNSNIYIRFPVIVWFLYAKSTDHRYYWSNDTLSILMLDYNISFFHLTCKLQTLTLFSGVAFWHTIFHFQCWVVPVVLVSQTSTSPIYPLPS